MARRLPYEHVHGRRRRDGARAMGHVDGFVLFLAPARRCAWSHRCSGQAHGSRRRVRRRGRPVRVPVVAATPVAPTTWPATSPPSSVPTRCSRRLPTRRLTRPRRADGLRAEGDVAAVTAGMARRAPPRDRERQGWPLPPALAALATVDAMRRGTARTHRRDRHRRRRIGRARRRGAAPPSLVAGVGASTGAPAAEIDALLTDVLTAAGLAAPSIVEVATIDLEGRASPASSPSGCRCGPSPPPT